MKPITLVVSPGRSGTQLLHSLLMRVPGMAGDHEDERYPSFATVRQKNLTDPSAGRQYIEKFLEYVDCLPGDFYSVTDLSSSYGPIEHYLDLGLKPNVIFLRRDPRLVSQSFFELDFLSKSFPSKWIPFDSFAWYPSLGEQGSLPIDMSTRVHSYQHAYWLCCDNEWRAQKYESLLPTYDCKIWQTSIPNLLDTKHFNSMLEHFDLPCIKSSQSEKIDIYAGGKVRELPPREFLHRLELNVLDRIPSDFKQNLLKRGWGLI
jgi:hypothetical protein